MTTDAALDVDALLDEPGPDEAGVETPEHELAVEYAILSSLRRYYANPRRGDVEQIAASLRRSGQ